MLDAMIHAKVLDIITTGKQSQHAQDLKTIISQVEHFYGEGWHTILWQVGLIVGALGVLAPLYINYDARKRMEQQIAKARRDAKAQTDTARDAMAKKISEVRETLSKDIGELETRANKKIDEAVEKAGRSTAAMLFITRAIEHDEQIPADSQSPLFPKNVSAAAYEYFGALLYLSLVNDSDPQTTEAATSIADRFRQRIEKLTKEQNQALLQALNVKLLLTLNRNGEVQAGNVQINKLWNEALDSLKKAAQ